MELTSLNAISPIDGRYAAKTAPLQTIFSEMGLMRMRLLVEIRWLQTLAAEPAISEVPTLSENANQFLDNLVANFNEKDALAIKSIEEKINHDLKAVEYFFKEKLSANTELIKISEFIHFACTSDDINNLAYALMLKTAQQEVLQANVEQIISKLTAFAKQYAAIPMLARTHGQAAIPTTLGKEFANFAARLKRQFKQFNAHKFLGKTNGAVGNFNAHAIAYPNVDWLTLSEKFVTNLGLDWNSYTTQIEPHDSIAEFCHILIRIHTLLIDLCRDCWGYISIGYLKQKINPQEVGSSTMPHKINPIDFENAEGNFGLANAILEHLSNKLPISRWQRDLVDSTLLRNLGAGIAHGFLAYQSLHKGLSKLAADEIKIADDLNQHWEVLAEAIQTVMRRYGCAEPYEQLKAFTRGSMVNQASLQAFIEQLELPREVKHQLKALTPYDYLGYAEKLALKV